MKRSVTIIIALVLSILVFVGYKLFISTPEDSNKKIEVSREVSPNEGSGVNPVSEKNYIEYSQKQFDGIKDKRKVLFFYANWCPTCRPADESFKSNMNKIPGDVTIIRVNYNDSDTDNNERELANKYNVTYQHTFVQIDEDGSEIAKWNGGQINELLNNLK